jgi:prepilin-type N-terminal cleavage/methylation domain-containing protein
MKLVKAFTLIELMIVILIVGILAAASVPLMRGRIDSAKWAEGKAAAGTIRTAVRARFAETGTTEGLTGVLSNAALQTALGFHENDLTGTYFVPGDYTITAVNANGIATIRVTGSQSNAPSGSWTLEADDSGSISPADGDSGGSGGGNGNGNNGNGNGNGGSNGNSNNGVGNGNGNGRLVPPPASPIQ